jgi:hypothetical protein
MWKFPAGDGGLVFAPQTFFLVTANACLHQSWRIVWQQLCRASVFPMHPFGVHVRGRLLHRLHVGNCRSVGVCSDLVTEGHEARGAYSVVAICTKYKNTIHIRNASILLYTNASILRNASTLLYTNVTYNDPGCI